MAKSPRIAQPGDIFLLLAPSGDDLQRLRIEQRNWQTQFGGFPVEPIHITVERFSPDDQQLPTDCVTKLSDNLGDMQAFPVTADAVIQFFAPYWQSYVLRWRVQRSPEWVRFRDQIKATLEMIRCPSHFVRRRHATCTILKLEDIIILPTPLPKISLPLFTVRELCISTLGSDGHFEVLEKLNLSD